MAEKNRFEPWLPVEIFVLLNLGFLTSIFIWRTR